MIKSILVFSPLEEQAKQFTVWQKLSVGCAALEWDLTILPSKLIASYIVVFIGMVWAAVGAGLLLAGSLVEGGKVTGTTYAIVSLACFTLASFTTHGIGGLLRNAHLEQQAGKKSESGMNAEKWRFFQPFKGGPVFVATQAAGWILYSTAIAYLLVGITDMGLGAAQSIVSWTRAAGASGFAAEVILALSLLTYNAPLLDKAFQKDVILSFLSHMTAISILYMPVHLVVISLLLTCIILPPLACITLWIGILSVYYSITGFGGAENSGAREWPAFQEWLGAEAERRLPKWLGSFEVVRDGADDEFDASQKYIFCYVPHGLYPLGAAYLPATPSFRRLLPRVRPVTLTASIIFSLPFLRDILLWMGARVVSKDVIIRCLRDRGSVMLVPGGQAELVEAYRAIGKGKSVTGEDQPQCAIYTRHRGFARIAVQEGASLVPVVVFGELTSIRNLVNAPRLQKITYKLLGFPMPFLVGGKLGVLPLPAKTGLKFVIGKPIHAPSGVCAAKGTDILHERFYREVTNLWNKYRQGFPGYESMPIVYAE